VAFLLGYGVKVLAINSPQIHCLAVDSTATGNVTVTWSIPTNLDASFISYDIYTSSNKTGPYIVSATITTSAQTSATLIGLGANLHPVYFYIVTDTTGLNPNNYSIPSDTVASIYLNLGNPNDGHAYLNWNAMHTPNLPGFSGWYRVYRAYPQYVWQLIDTTQGFSYVDTIYRCNPELYYKIEAVDASGCISVSNVPSSLFQNKNIPEIPTMDTVSVNGATNGANMSWSESSTPDVIGYVIYKNGKPYDTIYGRGNLHFYDSLAAAGSGSVAYEVAALDSCGNISPVCLQQNTIYLTDTPDSCMHNNTLSWTKFINLVPEVGHYKVYRSFNAGPFTLLGQTNSKTTTYVDAGLVIPGVYCYYVEVVDSTESNITASSNIICYTVTIAGLPTFSYLRTATVVASTSIRVDAYVDTSVHASDYVLQRANSPAGPFTFVGQTTSISPYISINDGVANPNNQSYTYIVISQNQCGYDIDTTQIGETMYLTATADDNGINTLAWNDYAKWQKGDSVYNIYRNEDGGAFALIATLKYTGAGQNVYNDNITGILQGQGIFGYYIEAIEKRPTYPFIDTSESNIAIAYQDPRMYIPNAFNPKGKNNIFIPIGVFVDLQNYDFQIFDRWGQLVFETQDYTQGWNGHYGGTIAPEGVYMYRIVYTSSKGEFFERKGTVDLLK
jgi:gliding motility-associated-like protein